MATAFVTPTYCLAVSNYVSGAVTWSTSWAPLAADPAPYTVEHSDGGVTYSHILKIQPFVLSSPTRPGLGTLTIGATVGGLLAAPKYLTVYEDSMGDYRVHWGDAPFVYVPPSSVGIGWHEPVQAPNLDYPTFTVLESNSGSIPGGSSSVGTANASLIGYTSGVIAWFVNGTLQVGQTGQTFGLVVSPGEYQTNTLTVGSYVVSATVDGVAASSSVVLTIANSDFYAPTAWGPVIP